MLTLSVLLLVAFLRPCSATSLFISIPASLHLPDPNSLSPSTHATLLSGFPTVPPLIAHLTTRSTVEFHNLTIIPSALGPQTYLLTISALSHVFAPYRVDLIPGGSGGNGSNAVIEGVWETYPGFSWSERGPILGGKAAQDGGASGRLVSGSSTEQGPEQDQEVRIEAKVLARRDFYEERPGFNPLGMLMNPMVLLGVMAMGIAFGMPYLMDSGTPVEPYSPPPSLLLPHQPPECTLPQANLLARVYCSGPGNTS